jgi:putative ABC transport system permease protein
MLLAPLTRKSLADVTRRKVRTLLVILGIAIGVGGLTAINVTSGAIYSAFAYSHGKTATADMVVDTQEVAPSLAGDLQSISNVTAVMIDTSYSTRWQVSAPPGHVDIGIVARADLAHSALYPIQLSDGRYPRKGEIVMEASDRTLQPFKIGDSVTITTAHGPVSLRVVGLSRTLGNLSAGFRNFATAYMSEDGMAAATGIARPNTVAVKVNDRTQTQSTLAAVVRVLHANGVIVLGDSIRDNDFDPTPVNGLITIMNALSLIALLLTGFLILNTVTTLVGEQTGIIGTMKAIGASRGKVLRGYLTTVLFLGLAGTIAGIAAGLAGGYLFTGFLADLITLDIGRFQIDPAVIVLGTAVGLGVPLAAAIVPVLAGTRISVREAISAYGVTGGGQGAVRPLPAILRRVPQTAWLGLRSVFRRRSRAVVTLLALTFSATAFLAIQTTTHSVDVFLSRLFVQYGTDMFVSTDRPQPYEQIQANLLATSNVASVERFENAAAKSHWGTVILTGTENDPKLYRRDVLSGRWFRPGDTRVVLANEQLASRAGLSVGDSLPLSMGERSERFRVIGIVRDLNASLGATGVALIPIDQLYEFEDRPAGYASGFMIATVDHSQKAVEETANRLDDRLTREGLAPSVITSDENISRNQNQFQVLYVLLYAVAVIVALVGVLGLLNTLTTSVLERRREIGVLRSLGATGVRVAAVFWTEGLALAGLAWGLAVLLGVPAAYGFVSLIGAVLIPVGFAFDPVTLLPMLVFTFAMATLATVIPALGAAHMRVAETLRYE